jgi:dsDNA-specific endonuclease/ATPase MutS2
LNRNIKNQVKNVFKIGDRVRFLNSVGTGVIEAIKNERMALVNIDNGLVVPHLLSNLVLHSNEEAYQLRTMNVYDEVDSKTQRSAPKQKKDKNNVSVFVNDEMVVDLHIEDLVDSHAGMSNGQILNIQLAHFNRELNVAIRSKIKKLIVIHGVGEGVLKSCIRKEMYENYPQYDFHDASYRDYGYGATEINLR